MKTFNLMIYGLLRIRLKPGYINFSKRQLNKLKTRDQTLIKYRGIRKELRISRRSQLHLYKKSGPCALRAFKPYAAVLKFCELLA